ncbi:Golgi membrane protein 1-like isoform X1 [Apis laboriosa]|uniref:Golgi membrane protein 1-like isoform X1 n=1 Tax=Apis laboriosa TaxID=183418 RepID=UPI001CC4D549|nr:Golgi membrane protein 1-like isoform X1 [Apis laboriosa]
MGIDSMRVGGGRCPPLLVGGLLVACLMLICNWWTLSSENIELVRQIDELNEQLKISAEERDQCVTLRGNLEQRYKHAEDEVASLHVRLEQQADLKEKNDKLEDSVNRYKNDLDLLKLNITKTATLETRQEKNNFNIELNSTREKNKKLQEEIEQLKNDLDKIKSTCNLTTQKKTVFIPQIQINSKIQKNNDSNGDMDDNPDPEISKTGNRGTDSNVIESGRDQHTSNGRLNGD